MDAGIDRDIKLQRASNSFIDEFRAKLPHLLWKQPNPSHDGSIPQRRPHRWAQAAKTEKLINLVGACFEYLRGYPRITNMCTI